MPTEALKAYARGIRRLLRANPRTAETGLAPQFQRLLEALLPDLPNVRALTVVPEYENPGIGRPDIALIAQGEPARAFIELKARSVSANPDDWTGAHNKRQYGRLQELANWATCNFENFRLFARDELLGRAEVVPPEALDPETTDAEADRLIDRHDPARFLELLGLLCRVEAPAARNAEHLAHLLAHSARIVRSGLEERLEDLPDGDDEHPLAMVRSTFRNVLYAHPEAGGYSSTDFNALFSAAFAQTLAFGLLLVREHLTTDAALPEEEQRVDEDAWEHMPEEHPLMQAALRVLSQPEVAREFGVGFDVMCDTVNSFAPEILAVEEGGRDPILYFYEDFLRIFDPAARERYGVYYTPVEVVRYMVGALDRCLRDDLGMRGLEDPDVTVLDPATGTGTFLLGVAERVREQVRERRGRIEAAMALSQLAGRMYGLELLVGPYAVAHYRLHHALHSVPAREEGVEPEDVALERLGVYLADTLSDPDAEAGMGQLGVHGIPIAAERREAQRIKAQQPVLAIIGNPPYRRLRDGEDETLVGRWMAADQNAANPGKWEDLKGPVREAGWGNELNTFPELSIAFWRWALWKLFEAENAPQRGVIAFITNRKFLTGKPYAGLRKMMRERFDRIEIVDLRGDLRAGVRGDVASDQGVFNIKVGTAITLCVADGSKEEGQLAEIQYFDSWADSLFSRTAKLTFLQERSEPGTIEGVPVERGLLDDFRPAPFKNGEWVSLSECFNEHGLGIQSKRDKVVYDVDEDQLIYRFEGIYELDIEQFTQEGAFKSESQAKKALNQGFDPDLISQVVYRPLDKRFHYQSNRWNYSLRPWLFQAMKRENYCLYTLKQNASEGPAVLCFSSMMDYHSFRGSYGGFGFALHGHEATNINTGIREALAETYGETIAPETVFDAVLALLSASSYTVRFAEDLEDTFPHIPFPASLDTLNDAAGIGAHIRELEGFVREPDPERLPNGFGTLQTRPSGPIADPDYVEGELILCGDGTGVLTGIPAAVWEFTVSGYRVLPRWLEAREGQTLDLPKIEEIRDIAGRIHELLHWFDQADLVLDAALADTLSREELGLALEDTDEADGEDDG